MKSLLQEESSVSKAIEKAWNISGKPYEFTVRILKRDVRNFWGILKSPAVISFTYNPKSRTTSVVQDEFIKKENDFKKKLNKKNNILHKKEFSSSPKRDQEIWKKEFVEDIRLWAKEILQIMGFKVGFNIIIENKMLNIDLDQCIFKDKEYEKMFFISLSGVIMQFLKRKYKKKFLNYYLIINSKKQKNDRAK